MRMTKMKIEEMEAAIEETIAQMEASGGIEMAADQAAVARILIAKGVTTFEELTSIKKEVRTLLLRALRAALTAGPSDIESLTKSYEGALLSYLKTGKTDG